MKQTFIIKTICIGAFLLMCSAANAQTDRNFIRNGNRLFRQQNYAKAEIEYRKALQKNSHNPQALYNLGCALSMQQKDSAAVASLQQAGKLETVKLRKAKVFHNIGVICQKHQMFAEAIQAYKEALRNNPDDDETRYNLALCKRQQKKQNNNRNNQQKNNKQQKKSSKNKQQNDKQRQQQQNSEQGKIDKQTMEQLLNAAMQEEKSTLQRLNKATGTSRRRTLDKNW